jgi:hypothetical protein
MNALANRVWFVTVDLYKARISSNGNYRESQILAQLFFEASHHGSWWLEGGK